MILDPDRRVVHVNPAAAALIGRPGDALVGAGFVEVFPAWTGPEFPAAFAHVGATGSAASVDPLHAGGGRWVAPRVLPGDAGFVVVMRDISEQKRTESALREREEQYRFLTEAVPQQIWTARPDGGLDFVNRRVLDYFGRTEAEMLGEGWQGVIHPEDLALVVDRWTGALGSGETYEVEFRLRGADGSYRWHLGRAQAMRDAQGDITRWFGTNTDIDDQKRAEQTQRFIIEASAVLAASLDYEVTLASVARLAVPRLADWCSVYLLEGGALRQVAVAHVNPEKVALAHELERRYPPDMSTPIGAANVARTGRAELGTDIDDELLVAVTRDAEHLRIARELGLRSWMCVPLRARDRTIGVINLVSAESGRRFDTGDLAIAEELARRCGLAIDNAVLLRHAQAAEVKLRRLNEELEQRVVDRTGELVRARDRLEEANARLKELDTMKDEFLGALSYQLASPINAVIGYADMLVEGAGGALREEQRVYVRRIAASSRLLLSLVHDLLDMSRMSGAKFELDMGPVDVCAVARDVLATLEPLTVMQGLRVVTRVAEGSLETAADGRRLEQVLTTVVNNALQLTASGGLLRLSLDVHGPELRFEVHHTGDSLSAQDIARIFQRFTRRQGAWLGLSIAQRIVQAHGGQMGVDPSPSGGNTFWFTLPARNVGELPA